MRSEPIEEEYFNWLYAKVCDVQNPTPSLRFYNLLLELHRTEFIWLLTGDDNRAQDGLDVRREFLTNSFLPNDTHWTSGGCSILEMLIAFSRKAEFETDLSAKEWFWIFLQNLNLSELNDGQGRIRETVQEILYIFVWRLYSETGDGGLFPLHYAQENQQQVEIWYQFHAYLHENEIF